MADPDPARILHGLTSAARTTLAWHTHDGVVHADINGNTKNVLIRRGLAEWVPGDDLCPRLTPLGTAVQALAADPERTDTP